MYKDYAPSLIFPHSQPMPEILGHPRVRQEVLQQIHDDPETQVRFEALTPSEQEALLEFCIGNRNLKITYDPFFRNIFHPLLHPNRLNRFLSSIMKQPVKVHSILPREGMQLSAEASFMIMDILVELEDGSLVNVEMQKIGYKFPIERTFCYGSDLLVRQYSRIKAQRGNRFSYKDIRPVYIIVLMEDSPAPFSQFPQTYMHHSLFNTNSGLSIANLLNFIYIPLDIFLQMPHNELTELEAWLYFLSSDNPGHIQWIIEKYPFFKELYQDIINLRYHPKELISMYSEALMVADQNTIKLMIEELQEELAKARDAISAKDAALSERDAALSEKDAALSEKDAALSEKDAENARLKKELSRQAQK